MSPDAQELYDKLVVIAYDDKVLVAEALDCYCDKGTRNLSHDKVDRVVDYILERRGSRWNKKAEEMAKDGDQYYAAVTTGVGNGK